MFKPHHWCIGNFHLHFPERFHHTFKWITVAAVESVKKGSIRVPEQPEFTEGFRADHNRKFLFGIEDKVNKTVIDPEGQRAATSGRYINMYAKRVMPCRLVDQLPQFFAEAGTIDHQNVVILIRGPLRDCP